VNDFIVMAFLLRRALAELTLGYVQRGVIDNEVIQCRVTVNGEQREIASWQRRCAVSELEYEGTHFAIAVNYDVLPKSRWSQTATSAGDEIEIITPRQGG